MSEWGITLTIRIKPRTKSNLKLIRKEYPDLSVDKLLSQAIVQEHIKRRNSIPIKPINAKRNKPGTVVRGYSRTY